MRNGGNQFIQTQRNIIISSMTRLWWCFQRCWLRWLIQPIVGSRNLSSCKEWKSINKLEDINHLVSLDTSHILRGFLTHAGIGNKCKLIPRKCWVNWVYMYRNEVRDPKWCLPDGKWHLKPHVDVTIDLVSTKLTLRWSMFEAHMCMCHYSSCIRNLSNVNKVSLIVLKSWF